MKRRFHNTFSTQQYISPDLANILAAQKAILSNIKEAQGVTCQVSKIGDNYFIKIAGEKPRVFASLNQITKLCPIYSIEEALMFLSTPNLVASTDGLVKFVPFNEKAELHDNQKIYFILDSVDQPKDSGPNDAMDLINDLKTLSISKGPLDDMKQMIRQNAMMIAEKACESICPVHLYTKLGKLIFTLPPEVDETDLVRLDQVVKRKQRLSFIKSTWACDFLKTSWPMSHLSKFVDLNSKTSKSQISLYLKEKDTPDTYQLRLEKKNKAWVKKDLIPNKKKLASLTILNDASHLDARTMLCYIPPTAENMEWLFDFVKIDPETDQVTCTHPKYVVDYFRFIDTSLYAHQKYDLNIEVSFLRSSKSPFTCSVEIHDSMRDDRFLAKAIGKKELAQRIETMNHCACEMIEAYTLPLK